MTGKPSPHINATSLSLEALDLATRGTLNKEDTQHQTTFPSSTTTHKEVEELTNTEETSHTLSNSLHKSNPTQ